MPVVRVSALGHLPTRQDTVVSVSALNDIEFSGVKLSFHKCITRKSIPSEYRFFESVGGRTLNHVNAPHKALTAIGSIYSLSAPGYDLTSYGQICYDGSLSSQIIESFGQGRNTRS